MSYNTVTSHFSTALTEVKQVAHSHAGVYQTVECSGQREIMIYG